MSRQRGARPSRSNRYETPLEALQKGVQRAGLQDVLNSLPAPGSFHFDTTTTGYDTVTLFLGDRPSSNGSTSQAWARIVSPSERKDSQPPLLFYDQEPSASRTVQYPRSASSLLRKATELHPPFCFLQHDPVDKATNVRMMLSAVILYIAAATGVNTSAWQWDRFSDSLMQALRYIDTRDAFHQWRDQQKLAALVQSKPITGTEKARKELHQKTEIDQSSYHIAEESSKVGASNNVEHRGGIVRSRGSSMTIRPNTSLAKLKKELGDRKFQLLDNIPPRPITISRHNIGGSLFPFRMLIGKAAYQETGESIDVYAYISHESARSSMVFMSHDLSNLEQIYDVNDMRDGVDLVEPLEYLNNLEKDSYKDDAKSARTAKLRSLISYYFFVAENADLISNPKVDINGGFCKRLCAACKELGLEDWVGSDHGNSEEDQENLNEGAEAYNDAHGPTQHGYTPEEDDDEFQPREETGAESSRIVRLRVRSEVLSGIFRSESIDDNEHHLREQSPDAPLAEESVVDGSHALQLELRPSSQVAHEDFQSQAEDHADLISLDNGSNNIDGACADITDERMMQARSTEMRTGSIADEDEVSTSLSKYLITIADEAAEVAHSYNVRAEVSADMNLDQGNTIINDLVGPRSIASATDCNTGTGIDLDQFISKLVQYMRSGGHRQAEEDVSEIADARNEENRLGVPLNWTLFGRRACFPCNNRPPMVNFLLGPLYSPKITGTRKPGRGIEDLRPTDLQGNDGEGHVLRDISSPAATPKHSRASSIASTRIIAAPNIKGPLVIGSASKVLAVHIGGRRPPTPEGSAERDLKSKTTPTKTTATAPQQSAVMEIVLISDDEGGDLAIPAPRNAIDRTSEARRHLHEDIVDLTQLSSSPRGKKRKFLGPFYISDSDKNSMAETDGSEWRRKSQGRRK
ncbi:hypothetical protein N0V86_005468 [Didymella sp. IMI 355093]|nr:hypothetical protein N0V86_005468 [Didymella sp. IMI 355093]